MKKQDFPIFDKS